MRTRLMPLNGCADHEPSVCTDACPQGQLALDLDVRHTRPSH